MLCCYTYDHALVQMCVKTFHKHVLTVRFSPLCACIKSTANKKRNKIKVIQCAPPVMANVYRTFWMNPLTGDMMWRRLSGFIEQRMLCGYKWQNTVSHYNVFVVSDLYKLLHVHYIIFILKWHIHQLKQDSTAFGRYTCLEMETFSSVFLCSDLLPEGFFFSF